MNEEAFFSKRRGFPGWVWPAIVTIGALVERILGALDVASFKEMASTSMAFWPVLLTISLTGTLGNHAHKRVVEARLGVPPEVKK